MSIAETVRESRASEVPGQAGGGRQILDLISLARPAHWIKSLLVVPVAVADPAAWSYTALERVAWATVAFILASALVYLVNDLADRRLDRQHPIKRNRPLAAGRVSSPLLISYGLALMAGFGLLVFVGPHGRSWPVLAYLALNVIYTCGLKHLPLLDVGAVSAGFVLRVTQGYVASETKVAGWLLLTIFSGSLLMLLGKRRRELLEVGVGHRPSLRGYTVELTNHLLLLTGALCLTSALAYLRTEAPVASYGQAAMLISAPFALYAISRYLQLVLVLDGGGDPLRTLLGDLALVVAIALWVAALSLLVLVHNTPAISIVLP
jgi:decaprenyl-phosphate phosphoribosyltransferase